MRSRLDKNEFVLKIKKKHIQEVIKNIDLYTEEDINNLDNKKFPKTIKDSLLNIKRRNGFSKKACVEKIAMEMIKNTYKEKDESIYNCYLYSCSNLFVGKKLRYEIIKNEPFLLLSDTQIKIGSTILNISIEDRTFLIKNSVLIDKMDFSCYNQYYNKDYLGKKYV